MVGLKNSNLLSTRGWESNLADPEMKLNCQQSKTVSK